MADFAVSLTDPVTGEADIAVASGVITIGDNSNYDDDTEAGHSQSDFSTFYKLKITNPDGTEYLFSAQSADSPDVVIDAPDNGWTDRDYAYTTGDGLYTATLYALPTYNAGASYALSKTPYVYYGGKIWQLLQNATAQTPVEGAYWTEIDDEDDLPAKYRVSHRFAVTDDSVKCFARRVYNSAYINNIIGDNWEKLLSDQEYIDAIRLHLALNAIPVAMAASLYNDVDTLINFTKSIVAKY